MFVLLDQEIVDEKIVILSHIFSCFLNTFLFNLSLLFVSGIPLPAAGRQHRGAQGAAAGSRQVKRPCGLWDSEPVVNPTTRVRCRMSHEPKSFAAGSAGGIEQISWQRRALCSILRAPAQLSAILDCWMTTFESYELKYVSKALSEIAAFVVCKP